MSEQLKTHVPGTTYFCTLTVVGWALGKTAERWDGAYPLHVSFCDTFAVP